jgi:hypothetical protein
MEKTVVSCKDYTIFRVGADRLHDIASFVVKENYNHHSSIPQPEILEKEIEHIYREELSYSKDSEYYIVRNNCRKIVGCIRVFRWDKHTPTPMEKIFNISPLATVENNSKTSFWHIGRFAIDSTSGFPTITLFKQLMALAVAPILREEGSYMIAETDSKLLKVMNALGIKTVQIGEPLIYLASETIPVYSCREGLANFYQRVASLLSASHQITA